MDEIEITITNEEEATLLKFHACKSACEKLVKETVKHFEDAEIGIIAWWDAITEKYNLDRTKEYSFNPRTKKINVEHKTDDVKQFFDKFNLHNEIRKAVRAEILGDKAKK